MVATTVVLRNVGGKRGRDVRQKGGRRGFPEVKGQGVKKRFQRRARGPPRESCIVLAPELQIEELRRTHHGTNRGALNLQGDNREPEASESISVPAKIVVQMRTGRHLNA